MALNHALALAEVARPEAALSAVNELEVTDYHQFHALRADLLRRLGAQRRGGGSEAISKTETIAEREFLKTCRPRLDWSPSATPWMVWGMTVQKVTRQQSHRA